LAARTVWRWYRIKSQSDKQTIEPLGFPKQVLFYHYLLPIRGVLIQEQLDQQRDPNETNNIHPLPAFVEGVFLKKDFSFGGSDLYSDIQQGATTDGAGNTLFGSRYVGGFSLDEERGVVEFSDWVVKYDKANKSFSEAELYLNCSYSVRDPESKMPYRYGVTQSLGGNAGVRVISAPDIQAKIRIVYDNTGKGTTGSIDNIEEKVKPAANELLAAAAAEYQTPQTEDAEYAGIEYIDLDGAIQQVGWTVSGSGVLTRASRNTEYDLAVPDFKKRREQRKIAALAKEQFLPRLIVGAR
jgi:hypothetical protein